MMCPKPEVLSQWADGSLDPREALVVGRHAETCDACGRKASELRAVGAWIRSAGVAGPSCLSAEEMASVIEGGRVPAHVRTCPRCASEFRALRGAERKATRRRHKPQAPATAWAAAAAIFIAVGILVFVANQQTRPVEKTQVRVPTRPENIEPPKPMPAPPVAPKPKPPVQDVPLKPNPLLKDPPVVSPTPTPAPVDPPVKPTTPEPAQPQPVKPVIPPTVVATAPPVYASVNVRSGGLSSLADGKWVKAAKIEEGVALRADGRTQIEFAQAKITLDGSSRFTLSKNELALADGGMSAEVATGSKFTLVLDEQRVIPQAFSRVMFCARPDRVVVEEGSAKIKDTVLGEGVEHLVKKDKVEAQKRRTLPAAARSPERNVFRMNLTQQAVVQTKVAGSVQRDGERRLLVSEPSNDGIFYAKAGYGHGEVDGPLFVVKPNTAIRFRYYMTQPGHLELVLKNITKDENFNRPIEAVVKQPTTVTLYVRDILANPGGKKVTCDVGDAYLGVTWFVGKPGSPTEIYIDQFEIWEIER